MFLCIKPCLWKDRPGVQRGLQTPGGGRGGYSSHVMSVTHQDGEYTAGTAEPSGPLKAFTQNEWVSRKRHTGPRTLQYTRSVSLPWQKIAIRRWNLRHCVLGSRDWKVQDVGLSLS